MTDEKIDQIADFMYSANSSQDVPFRISLIFGMSGIELTQEQFIRLMMFLRDVEPSKQSFKTFIESLEDES